MQVPIHAQGDRREPFWIIPSGTLQPWPVLLAAIEGVRIKWQTASSDIPKAQARMIYRHGQELFRCTGSAKSLSARVTYGAKSHSRQE